MTYNFIGSTVGFMSNDHPRDVIVSFVATSSVSYFIFLVYEYNIDLIDTDIVHGIWSFFIANQHFVLCPIRILFISYFCTMIQSMGINIRLHCPRIVA